MKKILLVLIVIVVLLGVPTFLFTYHRKDYIPSRAPEYSSGAPLTSVSCEFSDTIGFSTYDVTPLWWEKNNKFGIYVYAENKDFFELAQKLVNSSGGSWGYVLIPFNVRDTDREKWNRVFDQLFAKELIPVIQLWDIEPKHYKEQTDQAAEFLNSFVWPIKYKYVAAYNEPNDAGFWQGRVDPAEYATVLDYTITSFKKENPDFMILNAGFNTSASNSKTTMDAFSYMRSMNEAVPGIFAKLDAWASHSYPQPNFSGSPDVSGRWSIRAYDTELDFLKKSLGVTKDLPVFITETGWAHAEGENYNTSFLPVSTISEYFVTAYKKYWLKDDRVRAVMPFTIWYNPPYDHFSWVDKEKIPYKQYEEVKKLTKVKGEPPKLLKGEVDLRKCSQDEQTLSN